VFPSGFPPDRQPAELISIAAGAAAERVMGVRVAEKDRHRRRWCEIASRQRLTYELVYEADRASGEVFYDHGGTVVERFILPPDCRVRITTLGSQNGGHVAYWFA